MTDERKNPKSWFWFKAAILSAFTLYPLSFGPACWLVGMGWLPATLAGVAYYPIAGMIVLGINFLPQILSTIIEINGIAATGFIDVALSVGLFQTG